MMIKAEGLTSALLLALVALTLVILPSSSQRPSAPCPHKYEVLLNCTVPKDLPGEMPLLKIIPEPFPVEFWLVVAKEVFNMTGELKLDYAQDPFYPSLFHELWISGEEASLIISYGGSFKWCRKGLNWRLGPPPSFQRAKMMADHVLSAIRRRGLIPEHAQIEFEDVFHSVWAQGDIPVGITVSYAIRLHGFPFDGGFSVDINAQGVIGVCATWKFVEVDRLVKVISFDEALSRLADYVPRPKCPGRIDKIVINEIILGYAKVRNSPYIIPAYLLQATMIFEDGDSHDFHTPLPAVEEVPKA